MMAGAFIINGWVTFTMLQKLNISRSLPHRVTVGIPFSVQLTLENQKRSISFIPDGSTR